MATNRVACPCKIQMGSFSSERFFTVTLADGKSYSSTASYLHFWNPDKQRLGKQEPDAEETIDGFVAASLLRKDKSGLARIEIPDEEIITVEASRIVPRPQEVDTNVPVGS